MLEPQVAALAEALRVAGLPEEGDELRRGVVEQVEKLVVQWVAQVGVAGGLSEEQATTAGAKLLLLGSYALGALLPNADIDVAAVVPYFVERRHFSEESRLRQKPGRTHRPPRCSVRSSVALACCKVLAPYRLAMVIDDNDTSGDLLWLLK